MKVLRWCFVFCLLVALASGNRRSGGRPVNRPARSGEDLASVRDSLTPNRRDGPERQQDRGDTAGSSNRDREGRRREGRNRNQSPAAPEEPEVGSSESDDNKRRFERVDLPRGSLTPEQVFRLFNRARPRNPRGPLGRGNVCGGPRQECCDDDVCAEGLKCLLDGDDYWIGVEKRCMRPKVRGGCGVEGIRCCKGGRCLNALICAGGRMCRRARDSIRQPFRIPRGSQNVRRGRRMNVVKSVQQAGQATKPAKLGKLTKPAEPAEPTEAIESTETPPTDGSDAIEEDETLQEMEFAEEPAEAPSAEDPDEIVAQSTSILTGWLKISVKAEGDKCYVDIDTDIDTSTETFGEGTFSETFGELDAIGKCEEGAEGYAIGFIKAEVLATASVQKDGDCIAEASSEIDAESEVFGTGISIELTGEGFGNAGCFKRRLRELLDPPMSYQ